MTERFMMDECGTLIDMVTMDTYDYVDDVVDLLNDYDKENEQLKVELKVYRNLASCSNCKYHNYEWNVDDGYGGDEYEVCDKGNDVTEGICKDWVEL